MRSPSRTTPSTVWVPAFGAGTSTPAIAWAADQGGPGLDQLLSRSIRRTRRSEGTSSRGIGRENHKMMLEHYQQTKNLLVSYSPKKLGFF